MARDLDLSKYKDLVKKKIVECGPRHMDMMLTFIEDHFFDHDNPEAMKLAHKLHGKWFDSTIPKKQVMETKTEVKYLDNRFEQFINAMAAQEHKRIEVEEAEIISPEEALRIKNG